MLVIPEFMEYCRCRWRCVVGTAGDLDRSLADIAESLAEREDSRERAGALSADMPLITELMESLR